MPVRSRSALGHHVSWRVEMNINVILHVCLLIALVTLCSAGHVGCVTETLWQRAQLFDALDYHSRPYTWKSGIGTRGDSTSQCLILQRTSGVCHCLRFVPCICVFVVLSLLIRSSPVWAHWYPSLVGISHHPNTVRALWVPNPSKAE